MLKHLITKDILVVLLPEHCMLKSLVLFLLLHIILGIMNNGSFLVQLTGKLISAYVKSLVTVILLVPPLSNERLMYMLLNKVYTKIKKLFNTKIVIEPKKEIEFKSKIPEYTKWVIPINFMK